MDHDVGVKIAECIEILRQVMITEDGAAMQLHHTINGNVTIIAQVMYQIGIFDFYRLSLLRATLGLLSEE